MIYDKAASGRGNKVNICSPDTVTFTATQQSMTRLPLRRRYNNPARRPLDEPPQPCSSGIFEELA